MYASGGNQHFFHSLRDAIVRSTKMHSRVFIKPLSSDLSFLAL
jgi:hypothetical protein